MSDTPDILDDLPRTRRCLVHIGLNKTGSTTIQGWLAANRDVLAEQGILYDPFEGGRHPSMHHAIGFTSVGVQLAGRMVPFQDARDYLGIDGFETQTELVEDFLARAEASVARTGYHTYVISSEFLPVWLAKSEDAGRFHDWLTDRFDAVRYVVYLRDQIDWVPSAYSQLVRMGGTESLEDYLERRGKRNYFRTCMRWIEGTGRGGLEIRLLDSDFLKGDLVDDFAYQLGADTGPTQPPEVLNEAMDANGVERMLEINRLAARFPDKWTRAIRSEKLGKLLAESAGGKLRLTEAQALDVARRNAAANERLRRKFFPDRRVLFPKSHAVLENAGATEES